MFLRRTDWDRRAPCFPLLDWEGHTMFTRRSGEDLSVRLDGMDRVMGPVLET